MREEKRISRLFSPFYAARARAREKSFLFLPRCDAQAATDDGPFSSAVVPPPAAVVTDDFDFESYIAKEAGSGGGLFD